MSTTKDLALSILSGSDREQSDRIFSEVMKTKCQSALEAKKAAVATKLYSKED